MEQNGQYDLIHMLVMNKDTIHTQSINIKMHG